MGDNYAEVIIKKKTDMVAKYFRIFSIIVTIFVGLASILYMPSLCVIIIALFIWLCTIIYRNTDVEYEYMFTNGQLDVECIYGKRKRKAGKSFNFDKLEVMGPITHQKILAYEHRTDLKEFNYTSGYPDRDVYVCSSYLMISIMYESFAVIVVLADRPNGSAFELPYISDRPKK